MPGKTYRVFCVGTVDTKLDELRFLAGSVRSNIGAFSNSNSSPKVEVVIVDVSSSPDHKGVENVPDFEFVKRDQLLSAYGSAKLPDDRGEAVAIMSQCLETFLKLSLEDNSLAGAIGLGGSGGTSLISSAFRSLPIGVPKAIVSTVASGHTEPYVGTSDLVLIPSVVDVCGLNSVSKVVFSNAAASFAGMVLGRLTTSPASDNNDKGKCTVGITMFGVTTPCVNAVQQILTRQGYETLVFHATGVGGRAMESLVKQGFIQGVMDVTTTEVADHLVGGVMACDSSRFDVIIEKGIPLVLSVGALDMVNFGSKDTIPSHFQTRKIHVHNEQVSLIRTTVEERDLNNSSSTNPRFDLKKMAYASRVLSRSKQLQGSLGVLQQRNAIPVRAFAKEAARRPTFKGDEMLKGVFTEIKNKFQAAVDILRKEKITLAPEDPAAVKQYANVMKTIRQKADMFSESQRIKYDIENETKEIPDARAYLLKLKDIRTRRGLTDELGAEAMMFEALEKVEKDIKKPLLRSDKKGMDLLVAEFEKGNKKLGIRKEDLPKYEENLELSIAKAQLDELKSDALEAMESQKKKEEFKDEEMPDVKSLDIRNFM